MLMRTAISFGLCLALAAQSEPDPAIQRMLNTATPVLQGTPREQTMNRSLLNDRLSNWDFVTTIPVPNGQPSLPARPGPPISLTRLQHKIPGSAKKAYAKGGNHLRAGKLDLAVEAFQRAVALDPGYVNAYCDLGVTYMRLERGPEAAAAFQRAVALAPEMSSLHANLGWALMVLGRSSEAEASARQALRLANDNPAAHRLLGHVLAAGGPEVHAEAFEHFEAALQIIASRADQARTK